MIGYLIDLVRSAERHRAYYYRIALAVSSALVGAGFVTDGRASAIVTILGAVLGVGSSGLASLNTTTRRPVVLPPRPVLPDPTAPAAAKRPARRAAPAKKAVLKK